MSRFPCFHNSHAMAILWENVEKRSGDLCFHTSFATCSLSKKRELKNGGPVKYRGIVSLSLSPPPFFSLVLVAFRSMRCKSSCKISSTHFSIYSFNRARCLELRTSMITSLLRVVLRTRDFTYRTGD